MVHTGKKVIIIGGVAGGASCAARLRRLDEKAQILMVERGPYVSYANCGLPYHIGGVIEKESALFVASEATFREQFDINVRTQCEAVGINSTKKTVDLKDLKTGTTTTEPYDTLVISPGAAPIRPKIPGFDLPGIFTLRTVPDTRAIKEWLARTDLHGMDTYTGCQTVNRPKRAVVIGGGFIGLEMVENLVHLGVEVTLIEKMNQVMAPIDPELALLIKCRIMKNGVHVELNDGVAGFQKAPNGELEVKTESGKTFPADIVISAIGVKPETELANMAGVTIGERGGIRVDDQMRTSNPDIFAVGDAVEVKDFVTGEWSLVPLAGPANRQGRIAAEVICGRNSRYRGTQGTSICLVFGAAVASTGVNEKVLLKKGDKDYEKIYLFPNSHAGYYPGAKMLAIKVLFRPSDGKLLGAQVMGDDGVTKRIDSFAMAIQKGFTIYDLEESELCYAPPYGSAKDPVNFAGMVAADIVRGDMPIVHWNALGNGLLLDVRNLPELAVESVPGAVHIPLPELRKRLGELPKDKEIFVFCRSGQRAYYATRILLQNGFKARNIAGGMLSRPLLLGKLG
ncbi:MAG: FAD-dependent oxidoreductase [Elusimicrobia bacterium]|nr:FAD-dependent oxidoreductase [Elusimicrobiota bacterium]MBP9128370.1 FAD-dependent oxidoreductase [Elusimicrobiota bacterium]